MVDTNDLIKIRPREDASTIDLGRLSDPRYDIGSHAQIRKKPNGFTVRGSRHVVKLPRVGSQSLALLVGLLYGDGHLSKFSSAASSGKWRVEFAESDAMVVERYSRLTKEIFNIQPIIRRRRSWYEVYFCSKIVYRFYSRIIGHPTGRKLGKLRLPRLFRTSPGLSRAFAQGLFTAEGSVKMDGNIRVSLEMKEATLVKQLSSELWKLGFRPHPYRYLKEGDWMYGVYIYGGEVTRFSEEIGFVGSKQIRLRKVLNKLIVRQRT